MWDFFNDPFLSVAMIKTYAARLSSVGSRPLARRIWSQRLRSSNMIIYLCRLLGPLRHLTPASKPCYQYLVSRFQNASFWLYLILTWTVCLLTENKALGTREVEERTIRDVSREVCEFEDCLRDVLSDVLEVEMKAVYDDLWLEVKFNFVFSPNWTANTHY